MSEIVLLGDVAYVTKLAGYEFTKYITYTNEGEIIALRALNLKDGHLDLTDIKKIGREVSEKLPRSKLIRGDILLSYTGTVGNFAMVEQDDTFHLAPNVCLIRATRNKCLPEYLYYVISSSSFRQQLINSTHGSTQATVPMKNIRNLKIDLPSIDKQRNIVGILSPIDRKIELNRRMNETLEQIGQTLFRHYFITNPEAEKWQEASIYEFADVIYGAPFSSKLFNETGNGRPLLRIRDLRTQQPGFWTTETHTKGTLIKPGDIVVGMDAEFRPVVWAASEAWMNQRVCQFVPKKSIYNAFVLEAIKPWLEYYERAKIGTTVIHLGKSDIDKFSVRVPDSTTMGRFAELAQPIYDRRVSNSLEIQALTNLRNILLPYLISGKIAV